MRLDDLPRRTVIDGRHQKRRPVGKPPTEVEALRELLGQAQDVYRQALGCIVSMTNAPSQNRVREYGRDFLKRVDARKWQNWRQ